MIALEAPHTTETLERVIELDPRLRRLTVEIERGHAVSPDALELIRNAGCLRMAVPRAYGGTEMTLSEMLAVIEALSRAEGTLSWLVGQVMLSHLVFTHLPDETLQAVYAEGPDVHAAGAAAPRGRATAVSGGVRVSGRWPLVSGCRHARWLYAQCIVSGEDTAAGGDGAARLRTVVLRAEQARILGSWRGLGLHGSGSDDIHLKDHFSPASHVCDLTSPPLTSTASNRVPVVVQAGLVAAAVLIGAGHAAIEAVTELAVVKRPSFSAARLADQTVFQDRLGEACSSLLAAHALLFEAVGEVDDAGPDGAEDEVRLNAVAPKAAGLAREAIETAYDLGGSSSATEGSPLQRRLRDARSLSQHAAISAELLSRLGALAVAAN